MYVHSITHHSRTNGPGRRSILHLAGCHIRCPGCFSPHTWANGADNRSVADVATALLSTQPDGISISGGEPTEQAVELIELLQLVRPQLTGNKGILLYSGTTPEQRLLDPLWPSLEALLDAAVLGPYVVAQAVSRPRGLLSSENQIIRIYSEKITILELLGLPQLEVLVTKTSKTLLGFPSKEDIKCLQS